MSTTIEKIQRQIAENPILLYMKGSPKLPSCGFSAQAVQALAACGERFAYVDILQNPDIRAELPKYANWPTFPQLWVDGELVGGCDIVIEMYQRGELQQLGRTLADTHHARAGVVQAAHHRLARILEEGRHALDATQRLEILVRQLGELGVHHLPREHGRAAEDVLHVADLLAALHLIEVALDDLDRQAGGLGQPLRGGGALGLDLGRHVQHRLHRALRGLALAVEDLVVDVDAGRCRRGRLGLLLGEQAVVDV